MSTAVLALGVCLFLLLSHHTESALYVGRPTYTAAWMTGLYGEGLGNLPHRCHRPDAEIEGHLDLVFYLTCSLPDLADLVKKESK
jgi:hypothetical protein